MKLLDLDLAFATLQAPVPVFWAQVTSVQWQTAAEAVHDKGGRLVALWAGKATQDSAASPSGIRAEAICCAYATLEGLFWLALPLLVKDGRCSYPDLSGVFPAASRMQRVAAEMSGVLAEGARDQRPWLNHGAWALDYYPLLQDPKALPQPEPGALTDYPFVRVEGDGVHEIAVGPVHAGVIEPGHFRFSAVGEKILRLEQRLGYTHKGVEQRMLQLPPLQAHRLAGRVSGDSTVAYAWAYCMALESACQVSIPLRAAWLRALMLECERVANHLGDLGALGNDVGFAFALAQFSRLREDWLRACKTAFGHRLMMDCIVPGGARSDLLPGGSEALWQRCLAVTVDVRKLFDVFESHAGLQDRFMVTGRVEPALAAQLGMTGLAGRGSSQSCDVRCDHPFAPYDSLQVVMASHSRGDVGARAAVRFQEVTESIRLIERILNEAPDGPVVCPLALPEQPSRGAGWVEGWRGEIVVALELAGLEQANRIERCHLHDPSWQNWPVLEHAVMNDIVADFPVINKSFNLTYSGQDL